MFNEPESSPAGSAEADRSAPARAMRTATDRSRSTLALELEDSSGPESEEESDGFAPYGFRQALATTKFSALWHLQV